MTTHVFREPQEWTFEKLGHRGKVFDSSGLLRSGNHLIVEIDGPLAGWLCQQECDFVYYVLAGHGWFHIDDRQQRCQQGNLVIVPKGSTFTYEGAGLRMLLTSTPPWRPEQEQVSTEE
ncbi:AraC family ligand binding domain-containing protein [Nonomuraea sp. NPDC049400]|uniref:AraC family ligand binding domain-containing protein n=1 Tax=Nonomuraea sp. NPDC049400 TaxID=3364352 RepID=UPI0037B28A70